jgi:hypothetical protein
MITSTPPLDFFMKKDNPECCPEREPESSIVERSKRTPKGKNESSKTESCSTRRLIPVFHDEVGEYPHEHSTDHRDIPTDEKSVEQKKTYHDTPLDILRYGKILQEKPEHNKKKGNICSTHDEYM